MLDLSVIILVGNEELHIRRCLERLAPLKPKQVFVIESQTGDNTHDLAIETARSLGWAALNLTPPITNDQLLTNQLPPSIDRRAAAEMKVAEWLEGVEEATFDAALVRLVDEKTAAGEYRFKKPEEKDLALDGARRFFREFARKIIPLSDGRYVYFAPDVRAKARNQDNATSWAEYAFHAVSSSGKLLDGKNFRERLYNSTKSADLFFLEGIVQDEQCMYRLIDANPENDAVIFLGHDDAGGRLEVVTRLDQFGNAEANLGEVTVIAKHKRKEFPPPKFRPLAEVVETVAKHQAAGFSPSTTPSSIAHSNAESNLKTASSKLSPNRPQSIEESENREIEKFPTTTLITVFHAYPGNQAAQFNWALDNCQIESKWVLRLDADEYLTDELMARIRGFVKESPETVDLVALRLGRTWQGRRVRFGCPAKYIPRLFRLGVCRYGDQVMDERFEADPARTIRFEEEFVDDNLNSFEWWRQKHLGYMKREAQKAVSGAHGNKGLYYKLPPYFRAVAYWAARYFLFLGFLDGRTGWSWNFWQALWYRWQVDREIGRLRCRGKV